MQLTALIGKKTYQKQGFLQDGTRVPLSGIVAAGNFITQVKSADKEGYNALQLGIGINKKAKKSIVNHGKKAGLENTPRFFKEVRVDDVIDATSGTEINVSDVFVPGDIVDVTGISKGKGFAGGVKRWGFRGGPRTHGQSDRERAPGSIGQTTTPGRVYKGKKMAGRMGQDTVTVKNLEVIDVTADGVLLIKGLVPGSLNSMVVVKKMGTNKKFVPLYKEVVEEAVVEPAVEDVQEDKQDEALRSSQQLEESSNASTPASGDSGHGQAKPDSGEDSSRAETPRASEQVGEVEPTVSSPEGEQAPTANEVKEEKSAEPASVETTAGKEEVKKGEDK